MTEQCFVQEMQGENRCLSNHSIPILQKK